MPLDHPVQVAASNASDVIRAIIAACRSNDPTSVAFDLINAAQLAVCADDQAAKSAVALFLLRAAKRLDADVTEQTTLQ
jgi:hypothetical protein